MSSNKPSIVITRGDPAGIGPEITNRALRDRALKNRAHYIVIGDKASKKKIGVSSRAAGKIAVQNIKRALKILGSLRGRKALVTAPLNKVSLRMAGFGFSGHTELLAKLTKSRNVAMMFTSGRLKISLATRHVPLHKVASHLSEQVIIRTTELFYFALKQYFGIKNPRIGIAGLNPHAGESGMLGKEEQRIIGPAVSRLRQMDKGITGPYPADTLFHKLYSKQLDGAVCMYHDQGLAAFKMLYFDSGVNLTLGLPFIRTSPDHGTAFDIAGRGIASPRAMIEAIKLAIRLAL